MITIAHTHAEGTLVDGTARGDGSAEILKRNGFRWSRNLGQWYVAQSRDRDARQNVIDNAARALREAGFTVEVQVDNTFRSAKERFTDGQQRSAERAAALDAKAERKAAESDTHNAAARRISDMIPLGQPILVGHHSEGRHRKDLARIDSGFRKSIEAHREAEEAARRADAARATAALRVNPGAITRKIERLEAELRDVERKLDGTSSVYSKPADGQWRERLLAIKAKNTDEVAFLRMQMAEFEANGGKVWGPGDFRPGDQVQHRGSWYKVVRVNPKTLTVDWSAVFRVAGYTGKVGYDDVQDRREAGAA